MGDTAEKLTVIRQHNQGVAAARNTGIKQLDTKYIVCLDADDWLEPSFLEICIDELERSGELGIAYTGLMWHNHETGDREVSDWPGAYIAGKQFDYKARQNQIPTACVFRREAWERVGGYRSRYCPGGAGSEDAAFWTQILSVGYTAKQVTTEPLFNYSMGGQVSGSKTYHEIDWLAWLPYSRDKRYPFACSTLPDHYSHPVRQYDEPELSIIIPVGPGHEDDLRTALDSVEAQHFRNWEVVVVFDTGNQYYPEILRAYPYIKPFFTEGKRGPGYARNRGAEIARGKFLLFLDADDFLNPSEPNALGEMLEAFWETGNGIYSAHIGRATVSTEYAQIADKENRLMAFNEEIGQAYILNHGIEYDCEKAQLEPRDGLDKPYIWNLISTLIPTQWHFSIGGFDENMPTWEDWDYWLRMAKAGYCFTRIQKPFLIYNYISGTRRETGLQIWTDVLEYLQEKHKELEHMPCGCGSKKRAGTENMDLGENGIEIVYIHPNAGRHQVVFNGHNYGRHAGAGKERFIISKEDYEIDQKAPDGRRLFQAVEQLVPEPTAPPLPTSAPAPLVPTSLDFSDLQPRLRDILWEARLTTKEAVIEAGVEGLEAVKGVGPATAKKLLALAHGS
jgi:glycosyltransferase involved in cell wall biosynthesis